MVSISTAQTSDEPKFQPEMNKSVELKDNIHKFNINHEETELLQFIKMMVKIDIQKPTNNHILTNTTYAN